MPPQTIAACETSMLIAAGIKCVKDVNLGETNLVIMDIQTVSFQFFFLPCKLTFVHTTDVDS